MVLYVSSNQKSSEVFEFFDVFSFFNFTWYEIIKEVSFFFSREVWIQPLEHLQSYFVGLLYLCLPPGGGDLGGVGSVVEEGALDVVDLCHFVGLGPETVVLGRECLGEVT